MPFTFSHPAAVLPFKFIRRKWISMSALIVGSMIPDFEAFIRMKDHKIYGHTWAGMFWFDLPLGLAVLFLFHNVVRNALILNLPMFLRRRFIQFTNLNWNRRFMAQPVVVIVCLLAGIASHLGWDMLTHSDGVFPFYIVTVMGKKMAVYSILQLISSVVGFIVVVVFVYKMDKHADKRRPIYKYWLIATGIMVVMGSLKMYEYMKIHKVSLYNMPSRRTDDLIVMYISSFLIGIIAASLLTGTRLKNNKLI